MKTRKKLLAGVMTGVLALSLTACVGGTGNTTTNEGNTTSTTETTSSDSTSSETASTQEASAEKTKKEGPYEIGIIQLVEHQALDAATQGFQEALVATLGEDMVKFDLQNAQGEQANCATIVNGFVSNDVDLILANATPALQAAAAATNTIPIVGTSITDYATALGMSDWSGTTGNNITGTSDLAPLDKQVDILMELVPDVVQVGIVYCSAEANSVYQAKEVGKLLDSKGIKWKEYTAADSNEVQSVVTNAVSECDALYVPTDNTMAANTEIIKNVTVPAKIPVIAGEEGICAGGLATLSISYYDIGYQAGVMAAEILTNGTNPGTMPIQFAEAPTKEFNATIAKALGLTMPEDYVAIEGY